MTAPEKSGNINYRIVLKGYEATGIIEFAGTADETGREETIEVINSGIRLGSPSDARLWTAKDLDFTDDDTMGLGTEGFDDYSYWLQILQDGTWKDVKSLYPAPAPQMVCRDCGSLDYPGDCTDDQEPDDDTTPGDVWQRAYARTGNAELASEAASMYPGDYM